MYVQTLVLLRLLKKKKENAKEFVKDIRHLVTAEHRPNCSPVHWCIREMSLQQRVLPENKSEMGTVKGTLYIKHNENCPLSLSPSPESNVYNYLAH